MNPCAWCQQGVDRAAVVCGRCGKPVLASATRVYRAGSRYVFGEAEADRAAVWDLERLPNPVFIQPIDKLKMVSDTFDHWEAAERRGTSMTAKRGWGAWAGGLVIAFGILWGVAWAVIPSTISVLGFKGSCGVPLFTASTSSQDPFVQQCAHQSAQHLLVAVVVGLVAIVIGAVISAVGRYEPSKPAPAPRVARTAAPGSPRLNPTQVVPPATPHAKPAAAPPVAPHVAPPVAPPAAPPAAPARAPEAAAREDVPQREAQPTSWTSRRRLWIAVGAVCVVAVLASTAAGSMLFRPHHPKTTGAPAARPTSPTAGVPTGPSAPDAPTASFSFGNDGLLSPGAQDAPTAGGPIPLANYGYGPVKLGMSAERLAATNKVAPGANWTSQDGACPSVALAWPGSSALLATDPSDQQQKVVAIVFGAGMYTSQGIGLGSSRSQVEAAYPGMQWSKLDLTHIPIADSAYYSLDLSQDDTVSDLILTSSEQACFG